MSTINKNEQPNWKTNHSFVNEIEFECVCSLSKEGKVSIKKHFKGALK